MSIMNSIKGGADLAKPRASGGYIVGAVAGVIVLMVVFAIGRYLYSKGTRAVSGVSTGASGAVESVVGVFGNGT